MIAGSVQLRISYICLNAKEGPPANLVTIKECIHTASKE